MPIQFVIQFVLEKKKIGEKLIIFCQSLLVGMPAVAIRIWKRGIFVLSEKMGNSMQKKFSVKNRLNYINFKKSCTSKRYRGIVGELISVWEKHWKRLGYCWEIWKKLIISFYIAFYPQNKGQGIKPDLVHTFGFFRFFLVTLIIPVISVLENILPTKKAGVNWIIVNFCISFLDPTKIKIIFLLIFICQHSESFLNATTMLKTNTRTFS